MRGFWVVNVEGVNPIDIMQDTKIVMLYHSIQNMMSQTGTVLEYIRLARLHSSALSGLTLLFGALAISTDLDPWLAAGLFLVGILVHIFGFVLNEYFDLEVDRRLDLLAGKPLVSGAVKPGSALVFCAAAAVLSYLIFTFLIGSGEFWWPRIFLILSIAVFYSYDRWGKRWAVADALLAGYVGFLCLAGSAATGWPLNPLAVVVAVLAFGQLFLQNALANMKDVIQDADAGAKTTALRLGVRVDKKNNRFIIPGPFKGYILVVKLIHVAVIYGYLLFFSAFDLFQFVFVTLVVIVMMAVLYRILWMRYFERERLLRAIGGHELITYAIIPLLFIGLINPMTVILLIIFPVVWMAAFMQMMYGRLLPNI